MFWMGRKEGKEMSGGGGVKVKLIVWEPVRCARAQRGDSSLGHGGWLAE